MDTQLTWYGQSAFKIVTPGGKVLLVDPWLSNPVFENAKTELAALKHVDLILVTHGHSDHVGDAVEIGKNTGAKLVATFRSGRRDSETSRLSGGAGTNRNDWLFWRGTNVA